MIEFKVERFEESEDHSWDALLVKTPEKDWHLAEIEYGCEDESTIRNIIRNTKFCDAQVKSFCEFIKVDVFPKCNFTDDLDSPWGIDMGGVTVVANEDFSDFEVGYEVYYPGGYWEPPDYDYCVHGNYKRLMRALFIAYALTQENEFNMQQEANMEIFED